MRIIAGEFRGRKLMPPESDLTRPITDRAKQSVFDSLTPYIPDAVVFDCFAGTGSMGLEALSRGAAKATFFEADRSALARLKQNIAALGVSDRSQIVAGDLFQWFAKSPTVQADVIFLDPPYRFSTERADDLKRLAGHFQNALVVFRHNAADSLDFPNLQCHDVKKYGSMVVEFLRPR